MCSGNTYNRFILERTAGKLSSAVRHIEAIVDWLAGNGEKTFRGVSVPGEVDALRRDKAALMEALVYDGARMDNEEKAWSLLDDYMQPQEYLLEHIRIYCRTTWDSSLEASAANPMLPADPTGRIRGTTTELVDTEQVTT